MIVNHTIAMKIVTAALFFMGLCLTTTYAASEQEIVNQSVEIVRDFGEMPDGNPMKRDTQP